MYFSLCVRKQSNIHKENPTMKQTIEQQKKSSSNNSNRTVHSNQYTNIDHDLKPCSQLALVN